METRKYTIRLFIDLISDKWLRKVINSEKLNNVLEFKQYLEHLNYKINGNITGFKFVNLWVNPKEWEQIDFNLLYEKFFEKEA